MDNVEVNAGSRLHFGLICAPPESAWHYGGIGLMINQPGWQFRISRAPADSIIASPEISRRIDNVLQTLRARHTVPPVTITATAEVEPHTGLGSGTQLALSISNGLTVIAGMPRPTNSTQLAETLDRNRRSGIGTYGFDKGGFVIDRGRSTKNADSLQRICFPEDWRFVLLTPNHNQGLSGNPEESFFGEQPFLEQHTVDQLEQLIEQQIVVSIEQQNFPAFASSIARYGHLAGEYYARAQGGIFSNPLLRDLVASLEKLGITGAAQSSWGPTVCVPADSTSMAESIVAAVASLDSMRQINVAISRPLNSGATIRSIAEEDQRSFG